MVLMFVLTIFTVMQSMLRDTITTQDTQLNALNAQVAQLADALGLEKNRSADLTSQVGSLQSSLSAAQAEGQRQAGLIENLNSQLAAKQDDLTAAQGRIKFAEDGADSGCHRFWKSPDGSSVRLQEQPIRRSGVSTQTQDPIMTGGRKAPVEGTAISEVVLTDDEDLRALASGQFDRAVR
jgi:uncharacterized coiled-coil protein SlyX